MARFKFPSPLTPGAMAWISQYNGAMLKISNKLLGLFSGVPLWVTYNNKDIPCMVEPQQSSSFESSPGMRTAISSDTLNRQYYGQVRDEGVKGNSVSPSTRKDHNLIDHLRVNFGGFMYVKHRETPGTRMYFDKSDGTLKTTSSSTTLLVGIYLHDNQALIYPNRE